MKVLCILLCIIRMNILQKFYDLEDVNTKKKILKHFLLCIYNIDTDNIEDYRYLINEYELINFFYTYNVFN